jgi:hypothetical protein
MLIHATNILPHCLCSLHCNNSPFGRYEDDSDDLDDGEPETHWQPEKPDTDDEEAEETSSTEVCNY